MHARWLRFAGGEAQCAFEGAVMALLKPGTKMLDAACGTGAMARRLLASATANLDLTLLDSSPQMLRRYSDIPANRVEGFIEHLPFETNSFDLLTCAWGIETIHAPEAALAEFIRVTRPGGNLCLVFCANRPSRGFASYVLRQSVTGFGLGRFLEQNAVYEMVARSGVSTIRLLPCTGPAAAMFVEV